MYPRESYGNPYMVRDQQYTEKMVQRGPPIGRDNHCHHMRSEQYFHPPSPSKNVVKRSSSDVSTSGFSREDYERFKDLKIKNRNAMEKNLPPVKEIPDQFSHSHQTGVSHRYRIQDVSNHRYDANYRHASPNRNSFEVEDLPSHIIPSPYARDKPKLPPYYINIYEVKPKYINKLAVLPNYNTKTEYSHLEFGRKYERYREPSYANCDGNGNPLKQYEGEKFDTKQRLPNSQVISATIKVPYEYEKPIDSDSLRASRQPYKYDNPPSTELLKTSKSNKIDNAQNTELTNATQSTYRYGKPLNTELPNTSNSPYRHDKPPNMELPITGKTTHRYDIPPNTELPHSSYASYRAQPPNTALPDTGEFPYRYYIPSNTELTKTGQSTYRYEKSRSMELPNTGKSPYRYDISQSTDSPITGKSLYRYSKPPNRELPKASKSPYLHEKPEVYNHGPIGRSEDTQYSNVYNIKYGQMPTDNRQHYVLKESQEQTRLNDHINAPRREYFNPYGQPERQDNFGKEIERTADERLSNKAPHPRDMLLNSSHDGAQQAPTPDSHQRLPSSPRRLTARERSTNSEASKSSRPSNQVKEAHVNSHPDAETNEPEDLEKIILVPYRKKRPVVPFPDYTLPRNIVPFVQPPAKARDSAAFPQKVYAQDIGNY